MTGIDSTEKEVNNSMDNAQVVNQTNRNIPGKDEAPMAVLPLNSSAKLDQEPNPFEQSFSGAATDDKSKDKLKLPPVAAITSPAPLLPASASNTTSVIGGGILPKEVSNQFTWDTLRTGPLSPSMLQGPANPDEYYSSSTIPKSNSQLAPPSAYSNRSSFASDMSYPIKVEQTPSQQSIYSMQPAKRTRQQSTSSNRKRSVSQVDDDDHSMDSNVSGHLPKNNRRRSSAYTQGSEETHATNTTTSKRKTKATSAGKDLDPEEDEKRKNFLERNRIAALKCRQRKKQWLNNLQAKVEFLTSDNERLQIQSESLKEEIVNLKTLLLAHKECPVAQANGFHPNSIQKSMPTMLSTQMMRQGIPSSMGMLNQPSYLNRNSTANSTSSLQASQGSGTTNSTAATSSSSTSSIPQYQRSNMMSVQPQQSNQQGMVAGGSSGVMRF